MNLSFSTRGWGDLSWDQMLQEAVDMRFGGVEVLLSAVILLNLFC